MLIKLTPAEYERDMTEVNSFLIILTKGIVWTDGGLFSSTLVIGDFRLKAELYPQYH